MKRIFVVFAFLVLTLVTKSQPTLHHREPMSAKHFQLALVQILSITSESQKLSVALQYAGSYYFSSFQVKEIADLFNTDEARYEFATKVYENTCDPENFYTVYDSFYHFSSAMQLHDFLLSYNYPEIFVNSSPIWNVPVVPDFPNFNYPNYLIYKGKVACTTPLSDQDFMILIREVVKQQSDLLKMESAGRLLQNNCLTVSQVMKLASLFELETNRLSFLKSNIGFVFDIENYSACFQLFNHLPYRKDFQAFCDNYLKPPKPETPPPPPPCFVSDDDMNQIIESLKKINFSTTRENTARQIISTKKCFKVNQLKELIKIFEFENSKLAIAKFAYDFTIDKKNYYQINDLFTYSSSIDELNKYLQSKR